MPGGSGTSRPRIKTVSASSVVAPAFGDTRTLRGVRTRCGCACSRVGLEGV